MENKLQEAMNNVRAEIIKKITIGIWNSNKIENCLQILQQTIDKANKYDERETPKQVKITKQEHRSIDLTNGKIKYGYVGYCPNCNEIVFYNWQDYRNTNHYCNVCGQKLNWGNEE